MICTMLKGLYNNEWFLLRWKICTTLNNLYNVERFVLRRMIWSTMDDSTKDYWVSPFQWVPGVLIRKNTVKYFTLTSELIFSWFGSIKKKYIFYPAAEIGLKEMFLIALVETIMYFHDIFNNFLSKSDSPLCHVM